MQKLNVNLEEARQDLKETEYDKWLSDQEDMLDNLSDEMEDFFENIMQDTNGLIEAVLFSKLKDTAFFRLNGVNTA